ncbi:MAG: hypothetical protein V2A73_18660 [Pseudomonadota bacterium]
MPQTVLIVHHQNPAQTTGWYLQRWHTKTGGKLSTNAYFDQRLGVNEYSLA